MDMAATDGFARAVLDAALPVPRDLVTWNGSDPARRFAVYRNTVVTSLVEALATTFPVVAALVGDDFFRAMARIFATAHPPRSPVLAEYGADFPAFLAGFAPAAALPYLADIARLEAARVRAHHAADAQAASPGAFASVAPESLPGLSIAPHPAATVLRSRHAIVSLWAAHQGLMDLSTVDPDRPEDALVVRPQHDVIVIRLRSGEAGFLQALAGGESLASATATAAMNDVAFDLPGCMHTLVTSGFARSLIPAGNAP